MRPEAAPRITAARFGEFTFRRAMVELAIATATAVAATAFAGTFRLERVVLPLLVAAFVPALVDGFGTRLPPHRWWTAQVGVAVVGWMAVVLPLDRPPALGAMLRSLVDGWSDVLSTTAPATVTVGTVTVPYVLTCSAAVWAQWIAGRTARELTPILPPVLLAVVASLFAPSGSLPYRLWPSLFLVSAAAIAFSRLVWSPPRIEGSTSRSAGPKRLAGGIGAAIAASLLAIVVIGGTVVGITAGGARPDAAVFRRWWQPEGIQLESVDPFALVSASVDPRTAALPVGKLEVIERTGRGPLRLRLIASDRFDGRGWTTRGQFLRTGDGVRPTPVEGPSSFVDLLLEVDEPARLPFVPVPAVVGELAVDRPHELAVDADDGMWAVTGDSGREPTVVPAGRYTISGSELSDGAVPVTHGSSESDPEDTSETFAPLARRWAGSGSPADRAQRLEEVLRGTRDAEGFEPTVVEGAVSDPSVARVESLLGLSGSDGGRTGAGTPAEFAAAFALLGRASGLHTRLVLGFELAQPTPGRTMQLRRDDLRIWPEVVLDGDGGPRWVPFEPAPQLLRDQVPETPDPNPSGSDTASPNVSAPSEIPVENRGVEDARTSGTREVKPVGDQATRIYRPKLSWLWWLAALAVVGGTAAIVAVRRRRRRRRTRGLPAARIAAAWAELARIPALRKVPNVKRMTPAQTEGMLIEVFGAQVFPVASELHQLVDAGLFGPDLPTDEDAVRMWSMVDQLAALAAPRQRVPDHPE